MPTPTDLSGNNANKYAEVWRGQLGVRGATRSSRLSPRVIGKTFITYIEIYEQTAHDSALNGFAQQRRIEPRRAHRGRVAPANNANNPLPYYVAHGQHAASMVSAFITGKWEQTVNGNSNTFVHSSKQTLTSQSQRQPNDFYYEITMYYEGTEIYVVFHCYTD
ncbi:MAG: hypothetical protein ACREE5_09285 [Acetobacteraceae bacterium]